MTRSIIIGLASFAVTSALILGQVATVGAIG